MGGHDGRGGLDCWGLAFVGGLRGEKAKTWCHMQAQGALDSDLQNINASAVIFT